MKKGLFTKKPLLIVAIFSLAALGVVLTPSSAWAATRTWDGGAADNNWNSATNWSTDTAPVAGDDLVFPANIADRETVNNITAGTSFNSITFSGSPSSDSRYFISGNSIAVVAGITNSMADTGHIFENNVALTSSQTLNTGASGSYLLFEGVVSGSGNLTKTGTGELDFRGVNTFSGTLTANAGAIVVSDVAGTLGSAAGNTLINDGASLRIMSGLDSMTLAEPIVLTGGPNGSQSKLGAEVGFGPLIAPPNSTVTFTGQVTINSDLAVNTGGVNINLTNLVTNGYSVSRPTGAFGNLTINGTAVPAAAYYTTTFSGSSPGSSELVGNHTIATLNGTRGDITVYYDGTLKGTGTVGVLTVMSGGNLATGQSPGCITSGNFVMSGTLEQEIAGATACSGYDQVQVTGSVTLSGALTVSLLNGFVPSKNQVYTIITNDGADAVSGTFANLAEGAIVTIGGTQFRVSYVGGDGNDVTLTAVNVPGAPNTGAALITGNPALVMGAGALAVVALIAAGRKRLFSRK